MKDVMNLIKDKMKEAGYKLTYQRLAIVKVLMDHSDDHLSSESIYDIIKKTNPEIGLATVYRTMSLLSEIGIVSSLNLEDGCTRYELITDNDAHHHHHLICRNCGKVIEVEEDLLEELETKIINEYDFKILDHKLKFYGICSECKQTM